MAVTASRRRTAPEDVDIAGVLGDIHPYPGRGRALTHGMAPRRVKPGDPPDKEYVHTPVRGPSVRLRAVDGVCVPETPEQVRLADALRLPVIPKEN